MRFLQVWLLPTEHGVEPRYDSLDIKPQDKAGRLKLFLSPNGRDGSMSTRANAFVYAATLSDDQRIEHDLGEVQKAWLQVARGSLKLNGETLSKGDGMAIEGGGKIVLSEGDNADVLLFELP